MPKKHKRLIFVSYAEEDYAVVIKCVNILEAEGQIKCYLAKRKNDPGKSTSDKIRNAIRKTDGFLVFLSLNTNRSHWVHEEIGCALGLSKRIVPVANNPKHVVAMLQGQDYIRFDVCKPNMDGVADIIKSISKLKLQSGKSKT